MNYKEIHKEKIIPTPGGTLTQVFGSSEGASCSIALVTMEENGCGLNHYHDSITEVYIFSNGEGSIIINGNENKVTSGDIYIIPKNNVHYIKSKTEMNFCCICTPPWEEHLEHVVENNVLGENISKFTSDIISDNIYLYNIKDIFKPTLKEMRRVYYFIKGNGSINIDGKTYEVKEDTCIEVLKEQNEVITTKDELQFVVVYEDL